MRRTKFSCQSELSPSSLAFTKCCQKGSTPLNVQLTGALSDINALILDYLTTAGYPSAAANFSKEANLRPQQEEESVKARRSIQHSIHMGSIQEAIEALNELEPQVSQHFLFLLLCDD